MVKTNTWILVADAARARVFRFDEDDGNLIPVWEDQPVGTNLPSSKIASDRPGRTFDRSGEGRHAMEPNTDPARYESERFSRDIVERLDDARKQGALDGLIMVAPPRFLGDLRAAMQTPLRECVKNEINKDYSKLKPAEIQEHLSDLLLH